MIIYFERGDMIGWPSVRSLSTVISLVFSGFGLVSLHQNPSPTPGYNLYLESYVIASIAYSDD